METSKSIVDLGHVFDNSQFILAEAKKSNKIFVVKEKNKDKNNATQYYQVKKGKDFKPNTKYSFLNQCERSFELIHPAVLNLAGYSIDKPFLYYKHPDESHEYWNIELSSEDIQKLFLGVASGLSYLLSKGFYYTDFSIWSVILDKNESPKLYNYINFDDEKKNFNFDDKDLIIRYEAAINYVLNEKKKHKPRIKINPEFQKLLDRCKQTTNYPSLTDFIEFLQTKNFNSKKDVVSKKPFKEYVKSLEYQDKLISDGKYEPVNSIENISLHFVEKIEAKNNNKNDNNNKDEFKIDDFYFLNSFPEHYIKKLSNLLKPLSELNKYLIYEDLSIVFHDWKQLVQLHSDTNPFKIYKKLMKKIKELEDNKNEEIHMFNKRREIEIQIDALRIQAIFFLKKACKQSKDVQVKIELAVQYINGTILPYNFNKALDIINGISRADKKTKKLINQMKNKIETTIESASIQRILPRLAPKQKEILLKTEDEEDILSMLYCGFAFYCGFNGFPIMRILSIQFYRKAAKISSQAMTLLGYLYLKGVIFPQNFHRAKNCFKKAADKGDIKAEIIDCLLRRHLWRTYLIDFDVDRIFGYYIPTFKSAVPNDGLVIPRMIYLTEKNNEVLYQTKLEKESEKLHSERAYENTGMFLELSNNNTPPENAIPSKPFYSRKILLSSENFENTKNVKKQMSIAKSYLYGDNDFPVNYKEAAKYFKLAADKGNSEAQWRYALMCINQFDINSETKDIKHYFQKSIMQNDLRGKLFYALYLKNCGDNTIFEQIAQECCDSGSTDAMYYYALHLENIDLDESITYYKKAADQGHFYSLIRLIYIYKYKEMHDLYEYYLTLSVALMNEPLLVRLINFYDRIDEYKQSNILIQMGIKLNYRLFNAYYADHLLYGKDMKPNERRAEKFVILANNDNYPPEYFERYIYVMLEIYLRRKLDENAAEFLNRQSDKLTERYRKKFLLFYRKFDQSIAQHYYITVNFCSEDYRKCQNRLISLNKEEKINLPKVLADIRDYAFKDHNPYAIAILGNMYKQGKYVIRDLKKAVQFFALSAKEGCPLGYYYLGKEYFYGRILNQNFELAKENLKKALKNFGEPRAGYYLYKIPGIKNDENEDDVEYLKTAAYFGYKRALYKYGHRLVTGKDDRIPKNEKEGYEYIKQSSSQNYKKAKIFCKLHSSRYSYDDYNNEASDFIEESPTNQISLKNFDEDASYSDIESEREDESVDFNLSFIKEKSSPLKPISIASAKKSPIKNDIDKEEEKKLEFISKVEGKSSLEKDKKSSNKKIANDEKESDNDNDDDDEIVSRGINIKDKKEEENSELNSEEEEISQMTAFWY